MSFEEMRTSEGAYIDKTEYLVRLIGKGKGFLLSAPRGFGKTLMLSALEALFSGRRDLFNGLDAEKFFDRPEYLVRPVVHLDMNNVTTDVGVGALRRSILMQVKMRADCLGVDLPDTDSPGDAYSALLTRAADKFGTRVVVLIDEYDKPMRDAIKMRYNLYDYRLALDNVYRRIKCADASTHFIFVVGELPPLQFDLATTFDNLTIDIF
jgi:hypothetical protein